MIGAHAWLITRLKLAFLCAVTYRRGDLTIHQKVALVPDKRMTEEDVVARLESGMTIGIGGWGSRRKPMSLVRAILRSDLTDLHIVSYGGPDVGLLCATGKARKVSYGFVSLDSIPLEPHFRVARQNGTIEAGEFDEGAFQLGLLAAAHRVPFYPCRAGLGSHMMVMNPELKTVRSPYDDGEEFVAIKAFELDAALIHMNRADAGGNGQFLGPDLYFDDLFAKAATNTYMSCEKIVPRFLTRIPLRSPSVWGSRAVAAAFNL